MAGQYGAPGGTDNPASVSRRGDESPERRPLAFVDRANAKSRESEMKISEVMTRNVETVRPDQTAQDAANFMLSADAGSIPVTEGERLIGMITDRDIAVRGIAKGYGPDTPVRDLMTDDLIVLRFDDDIEEAASKMSQAQVRRLPVIDENERLCGIVSLGDLSRQTDEQTASQALVGVSQPGGQHQQ